MTRKSRTLAALVCVAALTACQTAPRQLWSHAATKDQFTDQVTTIVTIGDGLSDAVIITTSGRFYPFVGVQNGELHVGIRSGGRFRVPTGTVQIRIDNNTTWSISPDETPIHLSPTTIPPLPTGTLPSVADSIEKTQAHAMASIAKATSPYTATTGNKAKAILREMIHGRVLKYRLVGFNQSASSTGEVPIDASFLSSLRAIGINPESL